MEHVFEVLIVFMTSLCTFTVWWAQRKIERNDKYKKAMLCVLRNQMDNMHKEYMQKGNISPNVLSAFNEMYELYHNLGGNGIGSLWKEDLNELERTI